MRDRTGKSWADWLSERANRPFGDIEAYSGRVLQPFSIAGQLAAGNLLAKARRALDETLTAIPRTRPHAPSTAARPGRLSPTR